MGNRGGRFHDDARSDRPPRLGRRRRWIACVCEFKDRRRRKVFGRGYTELFFRDEPTALAAGHRPCFECRRSEALAFQAAFPGGRPGADAMDAQLHAERTDPGRAVRRIAANALPDGAMIALDGVAYLVEADRVWRWSFGDYSGPFARPSGEVVALTPPAILAALRAGYKPRRDGLPSSEALSVGLA